MTDEDDRVHIIAFSKDGVAVAWLYPNMLVEHAIWYYGDTGPEDAIVPVIYNRMSFTQGDCDADHTDDPEGRRC